MKNLKNALHLMTWSEDHSRVRLIPTRGQKPFLNFFDQKRWVLWIWFHVIEFGELSRSQKHFSRPEPKLILIETQSFEQICRRVWNQVVPNLWANTFNTWNRDQRKPLSTGIPFAWALRLMSYHNHNIEIGIKCATFPTVQLFCDHI
jgi:hypothetical protein